MRYPPLHTVLTALLISLSGLANAAPKPNVVIIYGDDVGFADIGVNGSKMIPTPNIDRLAAGGLNFTDGHSPAATCSASRFTMLTGILAHRRNITILSPTSALPIKPDETTLPKIFKDAGYATAVIGKWHLGLGAKENSADWNGEVKPGPLEIGFDYSFLMPNTNDRVPCVYLENYRVVDLNPADPISLEKKIDPRSTEYPDGQKNPEAMTFYRSTHGHNNSVINGIGRIGTMFGGKSALWNEETMSDEFVKRTRTWLDNHLENDQEKPFFLYYASQNIHVPRAPNPRFRGKSQLGFRGDSMVELDWVVGEIMGMLDSHGIADNTIVIFSSDNGPVYGDGYDDGTTVLTSTKEADRGHDGSGIWRGGKYQIFEGGTRVPMILRWPARIKPATSTALVTHTNFIASFARLLDQPLPTGAAPDSQDSLDALLGGKPQKETRIIEEARGYALRQNDWKLILEANGSKNQKTPAPRLYDLSNDPGEQHNIASDKPERVKSMVTPLQKIINGAGVRATFDTPPKPTKPTN
jgi:arylsulfatase A